MNPKIRFSALFYSFLIFAFLLGSCSEKKNRDDETTALMVIASSMSDRCNPASGKAQVRVRNTWGNYSSYNLRVATSSSEGQQDLGAVLPSVTGPYQEVSPGNYYVCDYLSNCSAEAYTYEAKHCYTITDNTNYTYNVTKDE